MAGPTRTKKTHRASAVYSTAASAFAATLAALVGLAASANACGSNEGTEILDASPGSDAEAIDANAADGSDSGAREDGGAASDARASDADAADATIRDAGPSYCDFLDVKPAFCDDFDHGAVGATWDAVVVIKPGTATLDDTVSTSAPNSLLITTPLVQDTSYGTVLLRKTVTNAAAVTHARLAFSFNPTSMTSATGSLAIATLDLSMGHLFTLYLRDQSTTPGPSLVETQASDTRFALTGVPAVGAWTRVILDLDVTNAKANVYFGSAHVLTDAVIGRRHEHRAHDSHRRPFERTGAVVPRKLRRRDARSRIAVGLGPGQRDGRVVDWKLSSSPFAQLAKWLILPSFTANMSAACKLTLRPRVPPTLPRSTRSVKTNRFTVMTL